MNDIRYIGIHSFQNFIAVIQGAGNDLERLKAGREGVLKGFKEAEKAWGGKLPEITYETLTKSLGAIDDKIMGLGGSVVDLSA